MEAAAAEAEVERRVPREADRYKEAVALADSMEDRRREVDLVTAEAAQGRMAAVGTAADTAEVVRAADLEAGSVVVVEVGSEADRVAVKEADLEEDKEPVSAVVREAVSVPDKVAVLEVVMEEA